MSFGTAYATKKRMGKGAKMECMAEGGEVGNADMQDADMIARIVHKRREYSEGGMVANDVGVAEADKLPAEYDELVLDDTLEDDSGPGNEKGDMVENIMKKRKPK